MTSLYQFEVAVLGLEPIHNAVHISEDVAVLRGRINSNHKYADKVYGVVNHKGQAHVFLAQCIASSCHGCYLDNTLMCSGANNLLDYTHSLIRKAHKEGLIFISSNL